jgi:hypothetical protein
VSAVFQKIVGRARRLKTVGDLFRISRPLSFEDNGVFVLDPPPGFEDLDVAIREERATAKKKRWPQSSGNQPSGEGTRRVASCRARDAGMLLGTT